MERTGSQLVLHICEELDHHTAGQISKVVDLQIEKGNVRTLIFDFSGITFMDSSGIGMVMGRHRKMNFIMEKTEIMFEFDSNSENESLARTVVAAFLARLDPTLEELGDVKTAVSEAVTNAIIHGYDGKPGKVKIHSWIEENTIWIEVADQGVGIGDVNRAMEPLFTTRPEMERSGMGFAFMEAFMDELHVESQVGQGTTIRMKKKIYSSFILS